jgi:hypothetical protein
VGQRGAQAVASLLMLGALALGARSVALAIGLGVFAAAWLVAAVGLRRHYVEIFRHQIRQGKIDARVTLPPLDLQSVESLLAALNSDDDARVIATLETLVAQGKAALIPALVLYHPSADVVLRALELLETSGRRDHLPLTSRLVAHGDDRVRAAMVRTRAALMADAEELRRLADDPSAEVSATARAARVSRFGGGARDWAALAQIAARGTRAAQLALLATIARLPQPSFVPLVRSLSTVEDPTLQTAIARAIQAIVDERLLPTALQLLGVREARSEARKAFLRFGEAGVDFLARALDDDAVPLHLRRHIPRTLSRFGNDRAAAILLAGLDGGERDGVVRFKMLRGLGRMLTNAPALRLDRATVLGLAQASIARSQALGRWRSHLEDASPGQRTPTRDLLVAMLARKERLAIERLFRYLDLLHPGEPLERIHAGLNHPDAHRRASSRELLEYLLEPSLRERVLALVDEAPSYAPTVTVVACVDELCADHSLPLRELAAEYRAELANEESLHASN